jgi:transcriptional regulator with PAS, ATPase and Fis domain
MLQDQIEQEGLRLGDSCSIIPIHGRRKAFTLNRCQIDLISSHYRPQNLSFHYIELPTLHPGHFHYRMELERERFILKTLEGYPFWLNGLAAREAYIERSDRVYIDENKIHFAPYDLGELTQRHFDHPILEQERLMVSELRILIQGETGTGKTHLAHEIHKRSGRRGEFIAVNLSSFNPQLIESELFGHKKGAFTGAINDKKGAFAAAEGGTLFLDEIDSLPSEIQTKLLTFMDNKKFRRVGDLAETTINARLVFASGRSLEKLVEQNLFRRDFYYRLRSGTVVDLSSLRNDVKKIKEACDYFALKHGVSFSQRLIEFYQSLAWHGNYRELFGHLEKKKILSKTLKIDFDGQDEALMLQSSDIMSFERPLEIESMQKIKEKHLKRVLTLCEGNVALTARKLQLTEKTVRSLLKKT